MKTLLRITFVAAVIGLAVPAAAQSPATGTFQVTAAVQKSCSVVATNTLAFGTYDTFALADTDAQTSFDFRCNRNTAYQIGMTTGLNNGTGTIAGTRAMQSPTTLDAVGLSYGLYRDAGRTLAWGTTIGTDTLDNPAGNASSAPLNVPIYGRIPNQQDVTAALDYSDTVTIQVNY